MKFTFTLGPPDHPHGDASPVAEIVEVWTPGGKRKIRYRGLRPIYVEEEDSGNTLTIQDDLSDGTTGWLDDPRVLHATRVHDHVCGIGQWDDGTPIGAYTAARLLWEAVVWCGGRYDKWWFGGRAFAYSIMTYLVGCTKTKANGWW